MAELSSWVTGCSCHEEDRKAGRSVDCPWAGCRATEMSAWVRQLLEAVLEHGQLDAHYALPTWACELCAAWLRTHAQLQVKLAWVFEDPYRIWQVR